MTLGIPIQVKEMEASEPIPEGLYKATVKDIEEGNGSFGEYLKFTFEITEGEHKGVGRTAVASKKISSSQSGKTSKLFDWVKALSGKEPKPGETFDVEQLKGKSCQIFVKDDKEKDGIKYQTIVQVMPS